MSKHLPLLLLLVGLPFLSRAQTVYYHVSNTAVYEFIDELATDTIIEVNSVAKPYSRKFIAEKLGEANEKRLQLNTRQQKELDFYLKDFNKEILPGKSYKRRPNIFFYKDSLFTLSVNPVLGGQYFTNEHGSVYHRWGGGEVFGYIGKHWGFYANLRDNHESKLLEKPLFLNQRTGANYKETKNGGGDYSEMRAGLTYTWKWGTLGFVKDHIVWGNNYNGANIFSGKTPSYAALKLDVRPVKWFELNYFHGWLVSNVIDSAGSYIYVNSFGSHRRDAMIDKYLAANLITITPWKKINISFGNSIIYSGSGIKPVFFIPILFYKSIDHWLNSTDHTGENAGQNSQMFFDISSRQIKNLHLYATMFFDELNTSNIFKKNKQTNYFSIKGGVCLNISKINTALITEFTRTNPLAFQHNIPTTTFESSGFNLGHYLRDNAQEYFFSLRFRPLKALRIELSYTKAERGKDYTELGGVDSSHLERLPRLGLPFMNSVEWIYETISVKINYQIINDLYIFGEYTKGSNSGDPRYSPAIFQGKTNTFSAGANFGF
jgi:hypothetical protein